ncbi:DUF1893 domain-containing protein [Dysosmobacter sp. HCP28S3_G4]|uniref:DUF1893 domain-containing protein n=1 Tax=Dysosmobacter sp. HCP28S3_G4 TaxID=3438938 RepID=UPI003F8BD80B
MQTKLLEEDVLAEARRLILEEDVPCVFVREGAVLRPGEGTGVRPLVRALDEEPELLRGSVVVDKIVGKAAAMLAVLGGAAGVYGLTMSAAARDYLAARGVPAEWETLTERIINRTGTGLCPMETAVLDIDDPAEGLTALRETMGRLAAGQ